METKELIKDLSDDAKPVKVIACPYVRAFKWIAISIAYIAILVLVLEERFDLAEKLQQQAYLIELALAFTGAILAALATAFLSAPDGYQKTWLKWLALLPFVGLAGMLLYQFTHPSNSLEPVNTTLTTYQCFADMLIFAAFPVIVLFYFIRKAAPTQLCWCGALAGMSAVNFSYIALRLIEPNDVIKHLLWWHYMPMVIVVLLGVILGERLLRW